MQERETKGQLGHLTPVPIELIVQQLPLQLSSRSRSHGKIAEAESRARAFGMELESGRGDHLILATVFLKDSVVCTPIQRLCWK